MELRTNMRPTLVVIVCVLGWCAASNLVEQRVIKEGQSTTFECSSEQKWFFCLWRSPEGGKICAINETGTYSSVCSGAQGMSITGNSTVCRLTVDSLRPEHTGSFICLLNQAVTFLTSRSRFELTVASPAQLYLGIGEELHTNLSEIEIVEGESIDLNCMSEGGQPTPQISWQLPQPGQPGQETVAGRTLSTYRYTGRKDDNGREISCLALQSDLSQSTLFQTKVSAVINILEPAPLASVISSGSHLVILLISGVIVLLVLLLVAIVFVCVKKKKKTTQHATHRASVQPIYCTDSPLKCTTGGANICTTSAVLTEDKYKVCTAVNVDVHNSSTSNSSTDSQTSTNTSFELERSVGETEEADNVSFSPTFNYTGYQSFNKYDTVVERTSAKHYQPRGLGHFDPSVNVHAVTRPNTAGLNGLMPTVSDPDTSLADSLTPALEDSLDQILGAPRFHLGARTKIHPFPQPPSNCSPVGRPSSSLMPPTTSDMDDTRSMTSVFDCQLGCFSPEHSHIELPEDEMQQQHQRQQQQQQHQHQQHKAYADFRIEDYILEEEIQQQQQQQHQCQQQQQQQQKIQ